MARKRTTGTKPDSTATIGFEASVPVRRDLAAEQAVPAPHSSEAEDNGARPEGLPGLIFLKYISDTAGKCRVANAELRTRNARPVRHSTFVLRHLPPPAEARWAHLQASAKQPTIGKTVDDAIGGRAQAPIERDWQMANAKARMWN